MDSLRILVTGGAGFLGSHLCERLLADGHEVVCVDNFFTGRRSNVSHLLENPLFELLRHDVTFPLYVEVDQIFNLACPASPVHYQHDPVQTTKTSVHGAINMLGLAKRTGAKILQASTSEVYGDPDIHPQPESYCGKVNPIGIRSCYDEGKRCAETLFFDYYRQHKLRIKVVRIFNTYGPRMHPNDGRVVSNFIVQNTDLLQRASAAGFLGLYSPTPVVHHHHRRQTAKDEHRILRAYSISRGAYFLKGLTSPDTRRLYYWPVLKRLCGHFAYFRFMTLFQECKGAITYWRSGAYA